MSELKATPGPWTAFDNAGSNMQGYGQPSGVHGEGDHRMKIICGCFGDIGGEEVATANANLIAAAPELYAALESALMPVEMYHAYSWPDRAGVIPKIKAALAKARGEA